VAYVVVGLSFHFRSKMSYYQRCASRICRVLFCIRHGNPSVECGFVNVRNVSENKTSQNKTINIKQIWLHGGLFSNNVHLFCWVAIWTVQANFTIRQVLYLACLVDIPDIVTGINYVCIDRNNVSFGRVFTLQILFSRRTKRVPKLDCIKRFLRSINAMFYYFANKKTCISDSAWHV